MAADFALFWSQYPRRVGRLAAERAWKRALSHGTVDEILEGVRRYRDEIFREKRERQFICHPATWLNQGRWMDDEIDEIREDTRERIHWRRECLGLHHHPVCATQWAHEKRKAREGA